MRLRTKLILVFVLLAVVPLAGIVLYSYSSSIEAFRRAVEAESGALAEEMEGRMDMVRRDLDRRVARLSSFPFRKMMEAEEQPADTESEGLFDQLMSEMGESADFVEAIEFTPQEAALEPPSKLETPAEHAKPPDMPDGLVIHLEPPSPGDQAPNISNEAAARAEHVIMHIRPRAEADAGQAERTPRKPTEAQREAGSERYSAYRTYRSEVSEKTAALQKKAADPALNDARTGGNEKLQQQSAEVAELALGSNEASMTSPLGREFRSTVHIDGREVGTVRTHLKTEEIFRNVLSETRRMQGVIPFAIDVEGGIHSVDPEDVNMLEGLDLAPGNNDVTVQTRETARESWIVVTRKDPESDVTFGIASPVKESLEAIRRTAISNLVLGLGIVGLALFGIVPLSSRMTRNLAVLSKGAEQLASGDLKTRVPVRSKDEFGQLAETFNRMAHELSENQKRLLEQERMQRELELCREIQQDLLPRQPLMAGVVEVKGVSIPAREVGGDFFNYFPFSDGKVALLVGDVSGKGISAALLMANLQATLQARIPLETDLAYLAEKLDREVALSTPTEVYLTLFMCILDSERDVLHYVNAGHQNQFLLRSDGGIEQLRSSGRPLGLLPGGEYSQGSVQLKEGDILFLFTDGLVETEDSEGKEFGLERLEALLVEERFKGMDGVLVRVEEETRRFRGATEASDDSTMVILKWGSKN